jgi:hypothetical protein
LRLLRCVHELHEEIDAFRWSIRARERHDVFFAQDWDFPFDHQTRALIAIGDNAIAKDKTLVGLEFDFQSHGKSSRRSIVADGG